MSTTFPMMAKVFGFGYAGFVVASDAVDNSILVPPDTTRRLIQRVVERATALGHLEK